MGASSIKIKITLCHLFLMHSDFRVQPPSSTDWPLALISWENFESRWLSEVTQLDSFRSECHAIFRVWVHAITLLIWLKPSEVFKNTKTEAVSFINSPFFNYLENISGGPLKLLLKKALLRTLNFVNFSRVLNHLNDEVIHRAPVRCSLLCL